MTPGNSPDGGQSRCIAIVGPFQSGKTSLLEALLQRSGAIPRLGAVANGTSIGDASREARAHAMGVEINIATLSWLGDSYTFVDCPGSVEFLQDMHATLPAVDAAIVVCEADEKKIPQLQVILRELEDRAIPHLLFLNKIDKADSHVLDIIPVLQPASRVPLLLRQIPTWNGDIITGFVDLALERAFLYREHAPSEVVPIEGGVLDREKKERFSMLEKLADHDDALMEQLLSDIEPPRDRVFDDLARELRDGQVCPVMIGSALRENGVMRLLKALRHEVRPGAAAERWAIPQGQSAAYVFKTIHSTHGGKLSMARVLSGSFADGATVKSAEGEAGRVSGLFRIMGTAVEKRGTAQAGDTVALGRLDHVRTGQVLTADKTAITGLELPQPEPVLSIAITARERKDDVKLGLALAKLVEEDPSLRVIHHPESHEIVLAGQGEMHLRVATDRLRDRFGVAFEQSAPKVGYRETIRKNATQRGRHKKQSGGHGQFGDVMIEIAPQPRGAGFVFESRITGGVVPKNYIPAVEDGVKDALTEGPLGFPVVDIAVALTDGSYHAVDSSDQAFRLAGRLAIDEALPQCQPVLLEPIHAVEIVCPSDAAARVNAILSSRRAQILGFDSRDGWTGWDCIRAMMPEAAIGDLIVELRSATMGVGSFTARFDHLAELTGKAADHVIATRHAAE